MADIGVYELIDLPSSTTMVDATMLGTSECIETAIQPQESSLLYSLSINPETSDSAIPLDDSSVIQEIQEFELEEYLASSSATTEGLPIEMVRICVLRSN